MSALHNIMPGKSSPKKKYYPLVSVCTPTFNRRPFIPTMFQCFKNQTYPKDRIEWIIVDDGTDKIQDLISASGISQIKYVSVEKKMYLGAKRNLMHSHCKGSIIVYMDDDDYYPPDRISHAVERLLDNPAALCAGSSEIYIYFKHIQRMIQFGPYQKNHATAGTFAFRSELLKTSKYEETAALAEERAFLKDYSVPFVQLDPMKTILCFSHEHNTFDKRRLLEAGYNDFMKESPKTVEHFIKNASEASIKKFFVEEVDGLLLNYAPGEPKMKPDVLKQINEILEERRKEMEKEQAQNAKIILQRPGEAPMEISPMQAVEMMKAQQQEIAKRDARIAELEKVIQRLLDSGSSGTSSGTSLPPPPPAIPVIPTIAIPTSNTNPVNKSEPAFKISDFAKKN